MRAECRSRAAAEEAVPRPGEDRETLRARLAELTSLFQAPEMRADRLDVVPPEEVPPPYRDLLVHEDHMTLTLERRHGRQVHLVVRERRWIGDTYCRRLVLTAGPGGPVILAGIIRFHMGHCAEAIRRQVEEETVPVGRILMAHCALRRIDPWAYLRAELTPELRGVFGSNGAGPHAWGRAGTIWCGPRPAVDMVEVVRPE